MTSPSSVNSSVPSPRFKYRFALIPSLMLCGVGLVAACSSDPQVNPNENSGGDSGTGGKKGSTGGNGGIDIGTGSTGSDDAGTGGDGGGTVAASCGNGRIDDGSTETCDDGNAIAGDGCSDTCVLEADFACPIPGEKCVSTIDCGDHLVTGSEVCDDGNHLDGDGCAKDCKTIETGWHCTNVGVACTAVCGDGKVLGNEECDFGGTTVTGCSSCKIADGYDCDDTHCWQPVCGNAKVERGEACDDTATGATDTPFDGCYKCKKDPVCSGGTCVSTCGDGQRFADEACDDGNLKDGDGCSSTCKVETGYACTDSTSAPPSTLTQPMKSRTIIG